MGVPSVRPSCHAREDLPPRPPRGAAGDAALPGAPPIELDLDLLARDRQAGRAPVDDDAHPPAPCDSPNGGDAKERSEGARHAPQSYHRGKARLWISVRDRGCRRRERPRPGATEGLPAHRPMVFVGLRHRVHRPHERGPGPSFTMAKDLGFDNDVFGTGLRASSSSATCCSSGRRAHRPSAGSARKWVSRIMNHLGDRRRAHAARRDERGAVLCGAFLSAWRRPGSFPP
jgi:hypothetical protein